ncbi:MAG: carbohydrate-binding domain-containing protein [Lachnospiraceae bacterium]|nr:carbohydrate-binding domain-containing protein [Lachnospiraceae bacterium]
MKKIILVAFITSVITTLIGCNNTNEAVIFDGATQIELSDGEIKADGEVIGTNTDASIYIANDIVYYESGHDFTYGEGNEEDAHTEEEATAHTVVHISQPGTYCLSGELSKGQIAVDLGEEAKDDSEAVVTLILNDVDITCEVAPAIIFYNVYECGDTDTENASKDVDTTTAGANVVIADVNCSTLLKCA